MVEHDETVAHGALEPVAVVIVQKEVVGRVERHNVLVLLELVGHGRKAADAVDVLEGLAGREDGRMRFLEEGVDVTLEAVALQLLLELLLFPAGDFAEDLHRMTLDDLLHNVAQRHPEHEAYDKRGLLFRDGKIGVGLQGAVGIAFVETDRHVAVVGQGDGVPVFPNAVVFVQRCQTIDEVDGRTKKHVALDVQAVLYDVVAGKEGRLQSAQGVADYGNIFDFPGMLFVDVVENAGDVMVKVLGVGSGVAGSHAGQSGLREFPAEGVRYDRHRVSGVVNGFRQKRGL